MYGRITRSLFADVRGGLGHRSRNPLMPVGARCDRRGGRPEHRRRESAWPNSTATELRCPLWETRRDGYHLAMTPVFRKPTELQALIAHLREMAQGRDNIRIECA